MARLCLSQPYHSALNLCPKRKVKTQQVYLPTARPPPEAPDAPKHSPTAVGSEGEASAPFRREESHVVEIPEFPAKTCLLVSHPLSHAAQAFSPPAWSAPRRAGLRALRQQGNPPFLALFREFINSPRQSSVGPQSPLLWLRTIHFYLMGRKDFI